MGPTSLRKQIQHVIYIVKENRTYDQVLGDLDRGNGDPALAIFPQPLTPNFHKLATQFVDLVRRRASATPVQRRELRPGVTGF